MRLGQQSILRVLRALAEVAGLGTIAADHAGFQVQRDPTIGLRARHILGALQPLRIAPFLGLGLLRQMMDGLQQAMKHIHSGTNRLLSMVPGARVPEPGSLAMMLAGLRLVLPLVHRWRIKDKAVPVSVPAA